MKSHFLDFGKKANGRPPLVDLTPQDLDKIAALFIESNRNKKSGSFQLAWVRFCESRPDLSHLVAHHMPLTSIPVAVKEACRRARSSVGLDRGGKARLLHESAYLPGTMRLAPDGSRRLYAGEQASVDDATRNVACWIPWPYGGCKCSDRFGVKLGRWQTLLVHDDASSFVPFFSSVFRVSQSYRSVDAASVIYRAETEVLQWDRWCIEGGVWQAKQTLAVLGGRFHSAKGRPNQKLVENFFGRLWTVISNQPGDVGRHRGEMKSASDLYLKCRQGAADPRQHFMSLAQAQDALQASIQYLNEKEIRSQTYGRWVPGERWEADLAAHPRAARSAADDFLVAPCVKHLKVRSFMIRTTEDGPLGVPMVWSFTSDWLHQYEGREISLYFDPLAEWPVKATVTLRNDRRPLGEVSCINAYGESRDEAIELVKSARAAVITQTRNLAALKTVTHLRHLQGAQTIQQDQSPLPAAPAPCRETPQIIIPHTSRETAAQLARASRSDLSSSLARRAARARENA